MIIDFHTHVFSPRIKQNRSRYIDKDSCFALLYAGKNANIATTEELIDSMDQEGVDISVIVNIGWMTHELCVETNDYILESVNRYSHRLVGFCTVQPDSGEAGVIEMERCARAGIRGVGELRPDIQSFDITDRESMQPFVDALMQHRLILQLHSSEPVGHTYSGKGRVTPDLIYHFISNFPDLNIICAHWGGGLPFYALMPEVKKAMNNIYFDSAASPFLYSTQVYKQVSRLVGADKILFGSDYPALTQERVLHDIGAADLPEETKSLILSGNARRLLGI